MAKRKMLTRRRRKKKQFASPKKLNPHQLLFPQFQDDVQVYFNPVPTKFVDNLKENLAADAENFHALLKDLGIVEHRASKFVQKVPNAIAALSIQKINKIVGKVMKRTSGVMRWCFKNTQDKLTGAIKAAPSVSDLAAPPGVKRSKGKRY